jgi:NADH-quinone oxidoreductase subunit A
MHEVFSPAAAHGYNRRLLRVPRAPLERPSVLAEYLPTLLFLIVALGIGVALIIVGNVLGPKRPSAEKLSPYECGFNAFEDARMQFDVRYYLIAILFIVFDLEIAFVFPWALVFRELGVFGLVEMGVFLALLVIGFVYVWKKGALEWE